MINRSLLFVIKQKRACFAHKVKGGDTCQRTKTPSVLYQSPEEVLKSVEATEQGLSSSEAQKRLAEYGRNELEEGEKNLLVKFIEQFKDLMIIILVAAAILSVITSGGEDIADAIIILAVVIINAAFGVYQEGKAEEAIEAPQVYV